MCKERDRCGERGGGKGVRGVGAAGVMKGKGREKGKGSPQGESMSRGSKESEE